MHRRRLPTAIPRPIRAAILAGALASAAGLAAAQVDDRSRVLLVFEIQRGDTFSGVAGRILGDATAWRKLYDAERSGIADPARIREGTFLEFVRDAEGRRYLRSGDAVRIRARLADLPLVAARGTATALPPGRPPEARTVPPPAPVAASLRTPDVAVPDRPVPTSPAVAAAPPASLTIGVLPNIAATALLAQYEPLRRYMERVTARPVSIVTAPNFKAFFNSTMQGEYDLAVTASHFARVAQADRGLVPIGLFNPPIRAYLITPIERPIETEEGIRGQSIAFANPQSLVAMYAQNWLAAKGLQSGRDYAVRTTRSDAGIGQILLAGEAVAAVMSNGEFRQIPDEQRARLRIHAEIAQIPNFIVLAHPRLGAPLMGELRGHLKAVSNDPAEGAQFRQASGVVAVVEAGEAQLRELDAYAGETRRLMGVGKPD